MLYNTVLISAVHRLESAVGLHMSPPSGSCLPPHPTLLGCHRAPDLSSLHHTAHSHWLSILHMVMSMFPCYSLLSSHPLLPLLCPQACSLCLHLHCCLADGFVSTILLARFLNLGKQLCPKTSYPYSLAHFD